MCCTAKICSHTLPPHPPIYCIRIYNYLFFIVELSPAVVGIMFSLNFLPVDWF